MRSSLKRRRNFLNVSENRREFKGQMNRGNIKVFRGFSEVFRCPLRDPIRGRLPSQRLSVLLSLIVLPLELSLKRFGRQCASAQHFFLPPCEESPNEAQKPSWVRCAREAGFIHLSWNLSRWALCLSLTFSQFLFVLSLSSLSLCAAFLSSP